MKLKVAHRSRFTVINQSRHWLFAIELKCTYQQEEDLNDVKKELEEVEHDDLKEVKE